MASESRKKLKDKFVRNAVPTEQDFKDLIDAPLNQNDDGIFRNPGEPLCIVARTDAQRLANTNEQKRALGFFGDAPAGSAQPDWLISLNPGQDPNNAATNRRGFGIANAGGTTRLFIDISGNVGIGTTNPPQKLSIAGGLNIDQLDTNDNTLANGLRFGQGASGEGIASKRTVDGNRFGLDFYTQSQIRLSIANDGNVGIGTTTPADQLDVDGRVRAGGLTMGPWPAVINPRDYAFIGSNEQDQANAANYALLVGVGRELGTTYLNASNLIGLRIGNAQQVTVANGAVTIGSVTKFQRTEKLVLGRPVFDVEEFPGKGSLRIGDWEFEAAGKILKVWYIQQQYSDLALDPAPTRLEVARFDATKTGLGRRGKAALGTRLTFP